MKNEMHLEFSALSQNESFARVTVASFIAQLDPTMDELTEIKQSCQRLSRMRLSMDMKRTVKESLHFSDAGRSCRIYDYS